MLLTMADKTDVSELSPETVDSDEVTRARFATLRDRLLDTAEHYAAVRGSMTGPRGDVGLEQMVSVAHLVYAAAEASNVLRLHSINELEKQKLNEMNEYFANIMNVMRAMEAQNDARFEQQRAWVEREMKARGIPAPGNAKVLSLVPNEGAPGPEPAG